ncbi:hypothetical protein ACUXCC_000791 [Cytobacillus horneckiae]
MEKTKLTGRIVTPDDSEYEQARVNKNLSVPKFPRIIVFCQDTRDILNALKIGLPPIMEKTLSGFVK